MKKARIMLSAITVVAVIGGALAFKANNFTTAKVYKLNAAGTACPFLGLYAPHTSGTPIVITKATVSTVQPPTTDCQAATTVQAE